MNGYSRIKKISTTRSKSVDFADLSHIPRSKPANFKSESDKNKPNHSARKSQAMHDSIPEHEQDDAAGEAFGIILSRSRKFPVSSFSSHSSKEMDDQENSSFHSVVKKSLFIKRSSFVSEGYSRINHQSDFIAEDVDETISKKTCMKKKGGKFLKAGRRLFGF